MRTSLYSRQLREKQLEFKRSVDAVSPAEFERALAAVKSEFRIVKDQHKTTRRWTKEQREALSRRIKACLIAGLLLLSGCTPALANHALLSAIAQVESGNDARAVGDGGRARGAWQMHKAARLDAQKRTGRAGPEAVLAASHLGQLNLRLAAHLKRPPTAGESYAAWNLGLTGFQRRGFLLARCPPLTRERAECVQNLFNHTTKDKA